MIDFSVRIGKSSDEALAALTTQLQRRGFDLARTFDLHGARASWADCTCPHHGTTDCDCDYSILLVYRPAELPLGLPSIITAHHHDAVTWLYLLPSPWTDSDATQWRERITDGMVAVVFSDESLEMEKELA